MSRAPLLALLALLAAARPAEAGKCLAQVEPLRGRYSPCERIAFAVSCPAGEDGKREAILAAAMEGGPEAMRCGALALGMEAAEITAGAEEVFAARLGADWPAWKAWMDAERGAPPLWDGHPSPFARGLHDPEGAPRALSRAAAEDAEEGAARARAALGSPDPRLRRRALATLARLRRAGDAAPVMKALEDPDASVRFAAAEALARLLPPGTKAAAEARLGAETDAFVRGALVHAYGNAAAPEDLPRLFAALEAPGRWESLAAARALGTFGAPAACEPLGALLEKGKDQVARTLEAALLAAGLSGCRAQVPLVAPFARSSQGMIRKAALFALATIRDDASLAALRALGPERLAELPPALRPE